MDTSRWAQIREVFHSALECSDNERSSFVEQACGEDQALRAEVELLIERDQGAGDFLEVPSSADAAGFLQTSRDCALVGERIGSYTIRGVLGRGGMGVVYEAEQENPRRDVALKVVRAAPYLDDLTARLIQRETQALARLDHAQIGAIYEAGAAGGLHYFAMERVRGVPLTQYPRDDNLSVQERLRLFRLVCDAVHYAHQRGVIHRDLKPSNILVREKGQPKILDFGLARITDPDAELSVDATEPGAIRGTLAYMSPEQACGRPDEIDTRSDVYALGVILYELLTDRPPYDIENAPLPEAARIICEQPPRPPGSISRALRGDLETITLKAIDKDPQRRYQSAAALSDDVERYLSNQPILARPPSAAYQLRKLVARYKLASILVTTLALVILASAATTGWLAFRSALQRDIARDAQTRESEARESAEEFAAFLERLFEHADPGAGIEDEPSLRRVLDDGYQKLGDVDSPLVRARLMTVMGDVYRRLSEFERARQLLESAVAIRRRDLGDDHVDVAESLMVLARLLSYVGDHDAAHGAAKDALEIRRRHFGDEHALVAEASNTCGEFRFYAQNNASAAEYFRTALNIRRQIHAGAHPDVADSLANLGRTRGSLDQLEEAESLLREALAMRQELGDVSAMLATMEGLGMLIWKRDTRAAE